MPHLHGEAFQEFQVFAGQENESGTCNLIEVTILR